MLAKRCLGPVSALFLVLPGCNCGEVEPTSAEVSASSSTVEAESPVSVRGGSYSVVTVTVLDEHGEPISGVEVILEGSREGHDSFTQPPAPTGEDGVAEGRVSSTVVGATIVSATAGGVLLDATAEVEFIDEQACPEGEVYCGPETGCVEMGSLEHCSSCHDACVAPENAEAHCEGSCGWSCIEGYASCDDDDETGCETALGTITDCLSCGDECEGAENAEPVCAEDGCAIVCHEGWGSCDGDLSTGCETELEDGECPVKDCPPGQVDCGPAGCVELGSEEHCLECHDACHAPANAAAYCGSYGCSFICLQGFANCDHDAATGCETELGEDGLCPSGCAPGEADCGDGCVSLDTIDDCGGCGITCESPANADAVCHPVGCGFVCHQGYGDCDGDPATGCEQSLDDKLHCGACNAECEDPPNAVGFCEDGETGSCGYTCLEGFVDCDGDPATGCETDLETGTCCDHESFVSITSPCMTAGAGGIAAIHIELRDIYGDLVPGADVSLDAGELGLLSDVVESSAVPGIYWALIEAPEAEGQYELSATATYDGEWACGAAVSMAPVTLEAVSGTDGAGTGGCIPRGGNLRVRVVDEEGDPISGAFVMVGSSAQSGAFHLDYEAFLVGQPGDAANDTFTGDDGYAVFADLGDSLGDPSMMVTAGADSMAYASVVGFDASDIVLVLESLPPLPDRVTVTGDVTPTYHEASNSAGRIAMALATVGLDIAALSRFDFMDLLEDDKTVQTQPGCIAGELTLYVPENIHFPDQDMLGCELEASPPELLLTPTRHSPLDIPVLQGDIALMDAMNAGESIPALISAMSFESVGMLFGVDTAADQSVEIELTADLHATMPVTVTGAPHGELWMLSVGDIDGLGGGGRLYIQGVRVEESASSLSATLTTSNLEGPFTGADHLAMALSMVAGQGASAVIDRVNTDRISPRVLDDFFNVPGGASMAGRNFSWPDVANASSPADYHVSRSILRRVTLPSPGSYRMEEEPFWFVYSPAGVRDFSLPALPPHAPRWGSQGYLSPGAGQENRWFLGLYHLGLSPDPAALEDGLIGLDTIDRDLTHLSITDRRM